MNKFCVESKGASLSRYTINVGTFLCPFCVVKICMYLYILSIDCIVSYAVSKELH